MQLVALVLPWFLFESAFAILASELAPLRPVRRDRYLRQGGVVLLGGTSPIGVGPQAAQLHRHGGPNPIGDEQADKLADGLEVLKDKPKAYAHFGDTLCPCIGFDNIEGTISLTYDEHEVVYPADLGSRCEAWENLRHPDCQEGGKPGPGKGWCKQAWCFVDPCKCHIPVLPKPFTLSKNILFKGQQLYFSYASCSGEESFHDVRPPIGDDGCKCVGFSDLPGTTDVIWKNGTTGTQQTVKYPAEFGGACEAWDQDVHPLCKGKGKKPDWCGYRWCYVDPCQCNLPTPPKVTMYLPWATFTGKSLYYSYETCGNPDEFTAELNLEACVNQKTKQNCLGLKVRNGVQKCAWTGTNCLGSELVTHPLCKHLNKHKTPEYLSRPRWQRGSDPNSQARSAPSVAVVELLLAVSLSRLLI